MAQSELIRDVLSENIMEHHNDQHTEQNSREIQQILLDNLFDVQRRNEDMLFLNLPTRVSAQLGTAVSDVKVRFMVFKHTHFN